MEDIWWLTQLLLALLELIVMQSAIKFLEKVFADAGFNVVNLGVMVSQDEFINAAIETGAKAILVSSLYGQGELDCDGLREKCIEKVWTI